MPRYLAFFLCMVAFEENFFCFVYKQKKLRFIWGNTCNIVSSAEGCGELNKKGAKIDSKTKFKYLLLMAQPSNLLVYIIFFRILFK